MKPPSAPDYFSVDRPAHFRARPDLVEELCAADTMEVSLPKTQQQLIGWLRRYGLTADQSPFTKWDPLKGQSYELTRRYVLRYTVLNGNIHPTNILTDARGWSVQCEFGGLWDFILDRAIEFAVQSGMDASAARRMLLPDKGTAPSVGIRNAAWSLGYECGTGLCTLLARDFGETERLYLAREGGYYTPFPHPAGTIF